MNISGITPLKVEGSCFNTGYGYSKFVKLKIKNKNSNPLLTAKINTFGIKEHKDRIKKKHFW